MGVRSGSVAPDTGLPLGRVERLVRQVTRKCVWNDGITCIFIERHQETDKEVGLQGVRDSCIITRHMATKVQQHL